MDKNKKRYAMEYATTEKLDIFFSGVFQERDRLNAVWQQRAKDIFADGVAAGIKRERRRLRAALET